MQRARAALSAPCRQLWDHIGIATAVNTVQMSLGEGLTCHLHYVSWDDVSGFDPLDGLAVYAEHLPHLGFIFFQSLNGILGIPLLHGEM